MGYQFATMSQDRLEAFLAEPRNAIVATLRKNGTAQLSPVWYLYEHGRYYFPILTSSAKYANLQRNPSVSLCIDGAYPDVRAVMVDGRGAFIEDSQGLELRRRIIRRYYETEAECLAAEKKFDSWGASVVVAVTPDRVRSQDYSGWEEA